MQFFALKTEVGFSEGAIYGYQIYLTQSVKLTDEIKISYLYVEIILKAESLQYVFLLQ